MKRGLKRGLPTEAASPTCRPGPAGSDIGGGLQKFPLSPPALSHLQWWVLAGRPLGSVCWGLG